MIYDRMSIIEPCRYDIEFSPLYHKGSKFRMGFIMYTVKMHMAPQEIYIMGNRKWRIYYSSILKSLPAHEKWRICRLAGMEEFSIDLYIKGYWKNFSILEKYMEAKKIFSLMDYLYGKGIKEFFGLVESDSLSMELNLDLDFYNM